MQITLESLKKKIRNEFFIEWFEENFSKEADSKEIIKKLRDIKISNEWMNWLFVEYKLNGLCEEWHDNGQLEYRDNYKDGEKQ